MNDRQLKGNHVRIPSGKTPSRMVFRDLKLSLKPGWTIYSTPIGKRARILSLP